MLDSKQTVGELIHDFGKEHLWENRNSTVDTVVIHYSSAVNVKPNDPFNVSEILKIYIEYGVSSHFLIDREGTIYALVPVDKKAWHCGGSKMPLGDERVGVNEFSIGIELVATEKSGFTNEQYRALASLSLDIETKFDIAEYVGHDQIAGELAVASGLRAIPKKDPGPNFDWNKFFTLKRGVV